MTFMQGARQLAHEAMSAVNPDLADKYAGVVDFLSQHEEYASGKNTGTADYIRKRAQSFADARKPESPSRPGTVPDKMVSVILESCFGIPAAELERIQHEHAMSMGAENLVGKLLERYLATRLEPHGWIWCSSAMVKAVDFIKPPAVPGAPWRKLQVKNRDNSENSSSSAIRHGTDIEKWFRTFSRKAGSNWAAFPDANLRTELSEAGFEAYVRRYWTAPQYGSRQGAAPGLPGEQLPLPNRAFMRHA